MLSASSLSLLVLVLGAPGAQPRPGTTVDPLKVLQGTDHAQLRVTPLIGFGVVGYEQVSGSFGAQLQYNPVPSLGVGLFGTYLTVPDPSSASTNVTEELQLAEATALEDRVELLWAMGLTARWRPIYGGITLGDRLAGRFRVDIGAGVGLGETRAPCTNGLPLDPNRGFPTNAQGQTVCNPDNIQSADTSTTFYEPNTLRPLGVLSVGVDVDLFEHLGLRVEVRDLIFAARVFRPDDTPPVSDGVQHRVYLLVGGSLLL